MPVQIEKACAAEANSALTQGSAVSTRGPKAGQRLAAMRRILSHAGGAVLTFAQQQQQAAGSSSLSLHVLLDV